jgi:hypothetical protein
MRLNDAGRMVAAEWDALFPRFINIDLDAFVAMPNHIHGIIVITGTIGKIATDGYNLGNRRGTPCGRPIPDARPTNRRPNKGNHKGCPYDRSHDNDAGSGHGPYRRGIQIVDNRYLYARGQNAAKLIKKVESDPEFDTKRAKKKLRRYVESQLPRRKAVGDEGGPKPEPDLDRLSNILKTFNDQFGNIAWSDADRVHKLITEDIPARVAADTAFQNAKKNSDKQNARIEHDKALARVMTAVLKDDTELFKQFMDNESFKRWLTDTVFGLTYEPPVAVGSTAGR